MPSVAFSTQSFGDLARHCLEAYGAKVKSLAGKLAAAKKARAGK